MNKPLPPLLLFTAIVMISSCSPAGMPAQTPTPTPPPTNVSCNELSFYLDPALGSGGECENVPESSSSDIPMDIFVYPVHIELTIQDYPLDQTQFPPRVWIYPVKRFSELLPEVIPPRVSGLESIISTGASNSRELPFLPPVPENQTFFSHEAVLAFNGGQGVRFITNYNEGGNPIDNHTIFYTFQGLTNDGLYWVAVTLPLSSPVLPDDAGFPPEGFSGESWVQNYDSYVKGVKDALEAQTPGSFYPTLDSLDSLVRSITIK